MCSKISLEFTQHHNPARHFQNPSCLVLSSEIQQSNKSTAAQERSTKSTDFPTQALFFVIHMYNTYFCWFQLQVPLFTKYDLLFTKCCLLISEYYLLLFIKCCSYVSFSGRVHQEIVPNIQCLEVICCYQLWGATYFPAHTSITWYVHREGNLLWNANWGWSESTQALQALTRDD